MGVIDSRVVNLDQLTLEHFANGDRFECNAVRIGPLIGAKDLGYSYDVVPPGKRSCPFHSHRGEEENPKQLVALRADPADLIHGR